jgi:pimeloyl-ACP methyl ester carboxylesterase
MGKPGADIEIVFVEAGGLRFEVHQAGDAASPKLALLLHGFPEHAVSWRFQMALLAERGYRVWAPNQRGYGRSSRPEGKAAYHIDHLVADVAALIDASGCDEVLLAGHDWGGIVAWEFAARAERPLDRLVTMNIPHPQRFREELATNRTQRRRSWYAAMFQLPRVAEWLIGRKDAKLIGDAFVRTAAHPDRFPEEVLEVYRSQARQPGALTAMLNWYRAAGKRFGADRTYERIEVPTLLVWGEADQALGKELTFGTDRLVKDLTVRYLPGISHWVQQDAPEEVNAILGAWLDGAPVPGNSE